MEKKVIRYNMTECSVPGCSDEVYSRGFCEAHYTRWRRGADMTKPVVKKNKISTISDIKRIFYKTAKVTQPTFSKCRYKLRKPCRKWHKTLKYGYGVQLFKGRIYQAHVLSWMVYNKRKVPKGKMVCHKCHNKWCIQPEHLYLGDANTNAADMVRAGRAHTKITKADVVAIRTENETGKSQRRIARERGLHQTTVRLIVRREIWRHVA